MGINILIDILETQLIKLLNTYLQLICEVEIHSQRKLMGVDVIQLRNLTETDPSDQCLFFPM